MLTRRVLAAILLLSLPPGLAAAPVRVSGRILTEKGDRGLAGARVELIPRYEGYEEAVRRLGGQDGAAPLAVARTDEEGFFELSAPESGCFRVRVRAEGYATEEHPLVPLVEDADLQTDPLGRAGRFEVRAVGPDGRPLAGIAVQTAEVNPARTPSWSAATWLIEPVAGTTGADGRAVLTGPGDPRRRIVATSPRFLGQSALGLPDKSPTLQLAPGRTVRIEVRGDIGGRDGGEAPVPGAVVRWRSWPVGVTGPDGRLEVSIPEEGPLTVESREGWQARVEVPPGTPAAGSSPLILPVRLAPPRIVTGKVVEAATGAPLAGALVWAGGSRLFAPPVHTGPDGGFRLALPALEDVSLEAVAAGHLRAESRFAPRDRPGPFLLKLAPAVSLPGVVVDAAGRPVAGAQLFLMPGSKRSSSPGGGVIFAASRADGRFQIPGLAFQAAYAIKVRRDGFVETSVPVRTPAPGQSPPALRIVLGAGQTLSGRTVDESGRPVAGAELTIAMGGEDLVVERDHVSSDATGRFEIRHLAPGTFQLLARHAGFASVHVPRIEIPAGRPIVDLGMIELPAGAAIEGRVTDGRGRPIEGAEVEVASSLAIFDPANEDFTRLAPTEKTGPDGMFRLASLEPGKRVDLTVKRSGYLPASVPGVPTPTTEPLRIELKTARGLSGRVVGPQGEPVPGAALEWVQETRTAGSTSASSTSLGTTDPEGRFQAAGLPPGPVSLHVFAKGYTARRVDGVQIPPDRDLEGFEIRLKRGTALAVRVLGTEGEPVPGAWVHADPMEPQRRSGDDESWSLRRRMSMNRTDEEGLCSVDLPEPGRYRVTVSADWRRASLPVEAGPGTTTVELRFPRGVAVSGRVTDREGQGIPRVGLRLQPAAGDAGGFGAGSEADGSFTIENVTDGSYRLSASRAGYSPMAEPWELAVAGLPVGGIELRLEKKEESKAVVTGRILGLSPSEAALARIDVFPIDVPDTFPLRGKAGADGSYRIQGLDPGGWMVNVSVPSGRQAQKEARIATETSEVVLDFDLKGTTVSGRVLVDGAPLSGAEIQGDFSGQGRTAYDGSFQLTVPAPGHYNLFILAPLGTLGYEQPVEVEEKRELAIDIPTGGLTGRVVSAGAPVPDAVVAIEGLLKVWPQEFSMPSVRSDGSGVFEVPRLAVGTYKLTVRKEGFSPAAETVEIRPGAAAPVEIGLQPAPSGARDPE